MSLERGMALFASSVVSFQRSDSRILGLLPEGEYVAQLSRVSRKRVQFAFSVFCLGRCGCVEMKHL